MLIVCPSCSSAYRIELSTLGPTGRAVRCARCKSVWIASGADAIAAHLEIAPPDAGPLRAETGHIGAEWSSMPAQAGTHSWDRGEPEQAGTDPVVATGEAPSIVPAETPEPPPTIDAAPGEDIETTAARRERRAQAARRSVKQPRRWPWGPLPTAIAAMAAAAAVLMVTRETVVRAMPQTASFFAAIGLPVNLRGLAIENTKTAMERHDGIGVLTVEGHVVNIANKEMPVPRLRFAVHNASGREIYNWTAVPAAPALGPGEVLRFQSRLASPPAEGRQLLVRFLNRRDAVAAKGRAAAEAPAETRQAR